MRTRPFTSGRAVSELALGTWGLSGDGYGPVSEAVQDEVISRARDYGISLFDTADVYGAGSMERRLGRILGADKQAMIATKVGTDLASVPHRKRFDAAFLREAVDQSSERLQRSSIDVVLLHNPSTETIERGEATGVLTELCGQGRIESWGVCAGSLAVARASLARGAQVLEIAYNVFSGMDLESLDFVGSKVPVLAHSVLSYGLLCGQWPDNKVFGAGDHRAERWTSEQLRGRLRQLSVVSSMLGGEVTSMRAAALRFVLDNANVSSAVLGPRSRVQLDQLVREAGHGPEYLPAGIADRVRVQLAHMGVSR